MLSISVFSQEEINLKKMDLTSVVPDSLLNIKVLHYAQELEYLDRNVQPDMYDTAVFYLVDSIISKDVKVDIYLFSFPSQLSHSPWGIAIKHANDYFLYTYAHLPAAISKIIRIIQPDSSVYASAISSIYRLLHYGAEDGIELKCELKKKVRYYYNIINWVYTFEKNDLDRLQHFKSYSSMCNPAASLSLMENLKDKENKQIEQWIQTSYGGCFPYKIYRVSNTKKKQLYLIETERNHHKEYDFLFEKVRKYDFYQIDNSFVPIMDTLKNFWGQDNGALFKSIECLSLVFLYYYPY